MTSVRSLANCVGLTGTFSVLGDFFGFIRRTVPPDPTGARSVVSLKRQLDRLGDDHHDVNVIRVGSDQFTDADLIEIDYSTYKLRNIWNQVSIGVGRVRHFVIPTSPPGSPAGSVGLDTPTTRGQLEDITDRWVVDNSGIDLFIPHNMNVTTSTGTILGRSAVGGPCEDKDDKGMNGSVAGLWGSEQTARTVAHELGHYLDLKHRNSQPDNLMCQSGSANSTRNSTDLTNGQAGDMRDHCLMRGGC